MPEPRVLPVVGTRVGRVYVPEWPGRGRATPPSSEMPVWDRWIAWRLLAGNGWEIARSAHVFPDNATCRAAVVALNAGIDRTEWTSTRGARPDAWSWTMTLEGELVAVASRFYKLQRDCESAVSTFLTVLPIAVRATSTDERTASSG